MRQRGTQLFESCCPTEGSKTGSTLVAYRRVTYRRGIQQMPFPQYSLVQSIEKPHLSTTSKLPAGPYFYKDCNAICKRLKDWYNEARQKPQMYTSSTWLSSVMRAPLSLLTSPSYIFFLLRANKAPFLSFAWLFALASSSCAFIFFWMWFSLMHGSQW